VLRKLWQRIEAVSKISPARVTVGSLIFPRKIGAGALWEPILEKIGFRCHEKFAKEVQI
jgi:hypothetical protein